MNVYLYVRVCVWVPVEVRSHIPLSWSYSKLWATKCRCWELSSGPWHRQQALLAAGGTFSALSESNLEKTNSLKLCRRRQASSKGFTQDHWEGCISLWVSKERVAINDPKNILKPIGTSSCCLGEKIMWFAPAGMLATLELTAFLVCICQWDVGTRWDL